MSVENMPKNQNRQTDGPDAVTPELPTRGDPPDWPKPDIPATSGPNFSERSSGSNGISGFMEGESGGGNSPLF